MARRSSLSVVSVAAVVIVCAIAGEAAAGDSIRIAGAAPGNVDVYMMAGGQKTKLGTVGADGRLQPFDPSMLTNKPQMDIFVLDCKDGRYIVVLAESVDALTPEDRKHCDKNQRAKEGDPCECDKVGVWIPGRDTVINVASRSARADGGGEAGFKIGFFGFGSGKWTNIANADSAQPVIDERANSANYNPNRQINIDKKGVGGGWGGGVDIAVRRMERKALLGARVGVAVENKRNSPSQTILLNRDVGGLIFEQQGISDLRSTTIFLGPTLAIPGGVIVTAGPAFAMWHVAMTQTGSLRAGCPSPCVVVRTDNVSVEKHGTDVGLHLGAEYYPGNRWFGFYASWMLVKYRDVYDPTNALAWPRDWTDRNVFAGVVVRTPNVLR